MQICGRLFNNVTCIIKQTYSLIDLTFVVNNSY